MAKGSFGVMKPGFDGADRQPLDFGDLGQGEILQEMEEEHAAMVFGQGVEAGQEFGCVIGAEEGLVGGFRGVGGGFGQLGVVDGASSASAPVGEDELVGDTEEPGAEASIVAEGGEVAYGAEEDFLYEVEAGARVADEVDDVGEEGELVPLEQAVPGGVVPGAGFGHVWTVVIFRHGVHVRWEECRGREKVQCEGERCRWRAGTRAKWSCLHRIDSLT